MKTKQAVLTLFVAVLSLFFGLNETALNSILNYLDPPQAGFARVLEVVDGDTIVVSFGNAQERIRLIGVDTPETHHPNKAVQCFGQAASNFLDNLLAGADVRLEADPTNTNRDRYDRLLRYVFTDDGELVNQRIVEEGYGFAYVAFPFQRKEQFVASQERARLSGAGLWSSCEIEESGSYINTVPAEASL